MHRVVISFMHDFMPSIYVIINYSIWIKICGELNSYSR